MEPNNQPPATSETERMPDLDSQPLWIKVAAMTVAIGGILALIALYIVRW
ncbi:MAG: hypothetical protein KDN22_17525 [Verrucomicrobiae bacterium]|nr:hypothetical protein [Verrucomicrobiae bacterium]